MKIDIKREIPQPIKPVVTGVTIELTPEEAKELRAQLGTHPFHGPRSVHYRVFARLVDAGL